MKNRDGYGKYHTAVGEYHTKVASPIVGIYRSDNITAFTWDVCNGFHNEFSNADCIYVEPSWLQGYKKFIAGTEAQNTKYKNYLDGIREIVKRLNVPTFLLCGYQVCKMLKPPIVYEMHFVFHGCKTYMAIYNTESNLPFTNEVEAREYVSEKYNCILDFSCGYGTIADPVVRNNKKAILSDINTDCIHYIIDKYSLKKEE